MKPNASTKYLQIKKYVLEQIVSSKLVHGDRLPTEKELCERFGVSRVTVQTALRQLQAENVIYRVRGGGSYVQQNVSGVFGGSHMNVMPFFIKKADSETRYLEIIKGIEDFCSSVGYFATVHLIYDNVQLEQETINSLLKKNVRAMIFFGFSNRSDYYLRLMEDGVSLTFIDMLPKSLLTNYTCCNNTMGGYLLASHLLEQGCRRIAVLYGGDGQRSSIVERLSGFRFAHQNMNIPTVPEFECSWEPTIDSRDEYMVMLRGILDKLFAQPQPPDAIFCINDIDAAAAYTILLQMGIRVPQDVALTGFDNLDCSRNNPVPITTAEQPFYDMGYRAAELTFKQLQSNKNEYSYLYLPVKLFKRESTNILRTPEPDRVPPAE